jgi:peroxiredoxin Q/BCP
LRDHYTDLTEKGYKILGVSADSQRKQSNFKKKFKFPYPLLADVDKAVIKAFDVWGPKYFMGRTFDGIHRITFVISEQGIIEKVIDDVKAKDHALQILEIEK